MTRFEKTRLPHTSDFMTLVNHNLATVAISYKLEILMLFLNATKHLCKICRPLAHSRTKLQLENWMCVEAWFSQIRSHIYIYIAIAIYFSYGLLGASGCGKTTLLRCILSSLEPDYGEITVLGMEPGIRSS